MLTRTRCLSISDPDWCWVQQSLGCTVFSEILCRNKNHSSRCESYFVFNQHSIFAQLDQPMRAVSRYSVAVAVVCSLSLSVNEATLNASHSLTVSDSPSPLSCLGLSGLGKCLLTTQEMNSWWTDSRSQLSLLQSYLLIVLVIVCCIDFSPVFSAFIWWRSKRIAHKYFH